jgi:hypothetical protein
MLQFARLVLLKDDRRSQKSGQRYGSSLPEKAPIIFLKGLAA